MVRVPDLGTFPAAFLSSAATGLPAGERMKTVIWTSILTLALAVVTPLATAQTSEVGELRKEIEALQKGQEGIQKDLEEIKTLLKSAPRGNQPEAFKPIEVSLEGAPIMGSPVAKVTLVEFTDYQCPFCARHFKNTSPQIIKDYVDQGKVRYAQREFPLTNIHPLAAKASEAALCAGEQDKYWQMHDALFSDQKKLTEADLIAHAETLGLSKNHFVPCLQSGKFAGRVKQDLAFGSRAGIRGTPSFLIGLTDPENLDKFTATEYIRGAQAYSAFQAAIDKLIEGEKAAEGSE